jgi:hypothetical protein
MPSFEIKSKALAWEIYLSRLILHEIWRKKTCDSNEKMRI